MFTKKMILAILFLTIFLGNAFCEEKWDNLTGSIKDLDIKVIAQDPLDSNIVFVGSSKRLYKSVDAGKNWKEIFTVYGDGVINFIAIDNKNSKHVYIATSGGLFKTADGGENWTKIFKDISEEQKGVLSVAIHPFDSDMIYVGTEGGLFNSKDSGKTWNKSSGEVSNVEINFIAVNPNYPDILYLATAKGIYKTGDMGLHWERIFITTEGQEESDGAESYENDSEDNEAEEIVEKVNCIAISFFDSNIVYAGTSYGIFITQDSGKTWQKMSSGGLEDESIKFIALSIKISSLMYVATDKGVFMRDDKSERWQKLYMGMIANKVNMLAFDKHEEDLWAVGDGGIFKIASRNRDIVEEINNPLSAFENEPTIREIQEAAIRYAEVSPEKIQGWRNGAKLRSLLPELSVAYDKTISYSGSNFWIGPYDWGVDISWDLADLIWNPYQKDIDVRSRLMVQLRDDILDEVTHLYYERKRLQLELLNSPPQDPKAKTDKELRLQELTANIDGLTGGYFSQRLKEQR